MAWLTELSKNWVTISALSEDDPITQDWIDAVADDIEFLREAKTGFLPGANADCVDATHESGPGFFIWNYVQQGNTVTLLDVSSYDGAVSSNFTTVSAPHGGCLSRVVIPHLWFNHAANEADAQKLMPGGSDDYLLFGTGDGSAPDATIGFYSGAGSAGGASNYDCSITITLGGFDYTLLIYADSTTGDLKCAFSRQAGGDDWGALCMFVMVSPQAIKTT